MSSLSFVSLSKCNELIHPCGLPFKADTGVQPSCLFSTLLNHIRYLIKHRYVCCSACTRVD